MNNIQKLRIAKGISQFQLAVMSNCNPSSIYKYEKGDMIPSLPKAISLAKALDCSVYDLIDINKSLQEVK